MTFRSLPGAHGESVVTSLLLDCGSQLTEPRLLVQAVSGHMSLKFV